MGVLRKFNGEMTLDVKMRLLGTWQEDPQELYTQTSGMVICLGGGGIPLLPCSITLPTHTGEIPLDGLIGAITFFTQREVNKGWQTRHEIGTTK